MQVRDRIKELRRVRAADLRPNPRNWRTHPEAQRDVLRGLLAEVGYADALLARELEDGSLELVDGHLRAETTPEAIVPVLVLDVTHEEAGLILATLDPLTAMAGRDDEALRELVSTVDAQSDSLRKFLDEAIQREQNPLATTEYQRPEPAVPELWQVVVDCQDEADQQTLYERLTGEGYRCRVITI